MCTRCVVSPAVPMEHTPDFKPDGDFVQPISPARAPLSKRSRVIALVLAVPFAALVLFVIFAATRDRSVAPNLASTVAASTLPASGAIFRPSADQWATLEIQRVERRLFRRELTTEGRIAIDEDRATAVYSPFSGRIIRLLAKPGD